MLTVRQSLTESVTPSAEEFESLSLSLVGKKTQRRIRGAMFLPTLHVLLVMEGTRHLVLFGDLVPRSMILGSAMMPSQISAQLRWGGRMVGSSNVGSANIGPANVGYGHPFRYHV